MSLVGSLEDLGLGDILQIISLSRKSGVLWIRSPAGEGQVLFRHGLVRGVFARGGPADLRDLVATRSELPKADLDDAAEEARARVCALGEVLAERGLLSAEQQDELLRDHISSSVIAMFGWATGEFSFEISAAIDEPEEELFLSRGVNPQFLALEGARLQDEGGRFEDSPEPSAGHPGLEAAFGEPAPGVGDGVVEIPLAEAELLDDAELLAAEEGFVEAVLVEAVEIEPGSSVVADARLVPVAAVAVPEERSIAPVASAPVQPMPAVSSPARATPPVVVIDPDLAVLEWLKGALAAASRRVHIFQRPEQGISRIRQYLARAETPWVLLASDTPADPLSGARDAAEFVRRLKTQAPRMPVFLLECEGRASAALGVADATLRKPSASMLADPRRAPDLAAMSETLRRTLDCGLERAAPAPPPAVASLPSGSLPSGSLPPGSLPPGSLPSGSLPSGSLPPDTLARLRELSARLRDPGSQGEVLSLVMRFAAETFSRVAMFMLRDQYAVGMAQVGLPRAGGPGDAGIVDVTLPAHEPGWFRQVIASKSPTRGAPGDEGDQRLAVLLGNALPREAYVAPIESGERVVALLYADNLPAEQPIGDSSALEVVLHEAGLALDRAVLERALAEAEQR